MRKRRTPTQAAWDRRAKLAREYGITQNEVATEAGVNRSMVSKCRHQKATSANVEAAFDRVIARHAAEVKAWASTAWLQATSSHSKKMKA